MDIHSSILSGNLLFNDLDDLTFDTIKEQKLHEILDCVEANVLLSTCRNPELSIRLIKELGTGVDSFEHLPFELVQKYFDLGLHKITKPPNSYFNILTGEEIEDPSDRFEKREIELFIEHPKMVKFCDSDEFKNKKFFGKLCHISKPVFRHNDIFVYPIEIAILHNYKDLIFEIAPVAGINYDFSQFTNLDDETINYFFEKYHLDFSKGDLFDIISHINRPIIYEYAIKYNYTHCIFEHAFIKGNIELIDFIFKRVNPEGITYLYPKYFGELRDISQVTYEHLIEKYPNYRGFLYGNGLLYVCLLLHLRPFPKNICMEDLSSCAEMNLTKEECRFILRQGQIFDDEIYESFAYDVYGEDYEDDPSILCMHPKLIKYIPNEKYADKSFFAKLSCAWGTVFQISTEVYEENYGVSKFIAMQYNYKEFITDSCANELPYYLRFHQDRDVFIKLYSKIQDRFIKEEVFRIMIIKDYKNLIALFVPFQKFTLDYRIELDQEEFDYLVENFPRLDVEDPYNEYTCGLFTYGVYHKLKNLPEYDDDYDQMVILTIIHDYDEKYLDENVFPNQELYDRFFKGDRQQIMQKYLPLFRDVSPKIKQKFGNGLSQCSRKQL